MKFHGVQIQEGSSISNLTVASGTAFPALPNEAEVFYRTDSDIRIRGLYAYIGGTWDRIASADAVTAPSAANFPTLANTGDLFYKDSNDASEALYVYNGATWIPAASGSGSTATVTGDVTGTLLIGGTGALTLANVTAGTTVGTSANSTVITYDSKGRITGSTTTPIAIAATQVTTGSFSDARIAQSNVTQHQGALSLSASQTTSGTFADAQITASNITQHQAALTILETQITNGTLLARLADNETITGAYQFNNPIVTATPISGSHATTKDYVDQAIAGLSWKNSVLVATTANITLSGLQTVDGVAVIAGNRVLVKNQSTQAQNGVYVVAASAWTRAADFDAVSPLDEVNSAAVFVRSGTAQADTAWTQTAPVVLIDSDALVFAQFAGSNTFIAGAGLTITGNSFDVNTASTSRIVVNTDNIDLAIVTNSGAGTFQKLTIDAYGRVSGTAAVVAADITALVNATYVAKSGDTMTGNLAVTASSGVASTRMESTDAASSARIQLGANGANMSQFAQYGASHAGNFMSTIPIAGLTALFTGAASTGFIISQQSAAPLILATSAIERMRIDLVGNVGIGTISPTRKLTIAGTGAFNSGTSPAIRLDNTTSGRLAIIDFDSSDFLNIWASDTGLGGIKFLTSSGVGTERMRIDSAGNVGIGGTSAGASLHVYTGSASRIATFETTSSTTGAIQIKNTGSGAQPPQFLSINDDMAFQTAGAERVRIDAAGNVLVGTTSSLSDSAKLRVYAATNQVAAEFYGAGTLNTSKITLANDNNSGAISVVAGDMMFYANTRTTERMRIDSAGNVGIGAIPGTWAAAAKAIEFTYPSFGQDANGAAIMSFNARNTGIGTWVYKSVDEASLFLADTDGSFKWSNAVSGATGSTAPLVERMRIDSAGNVGIGGAPASSKLDVYGSVRIRDQDLISLSATGGEVRLGYGAYNAAAAWNLWSAAAQPITIGTNNTERMRIASSGGVTFGTSAASAPAVIITGNSGRPVLSFVGTGASPQTWNTQLKTDAAQNWYMIANTGETVGVYMTPTVSGWNNLSDERFKENWVELTDAVAKIKTLRAGTHTWIADPTLPRDVGLIAQDVLSVLPEAVDTSDSTRLGVRYTHIVPLLVKALQEALARIEALEAK